LEGENRKLRDEIEVLGSDWVTGVHLRAAELCEEIAAKATAAKERDGGFDPTPYFWNDLLPVLDYVRHLRSVGSNLAVGVRSLIAFPASRDEKLRRLHDYCLRNGFGGSPLRKKPTATWTEIDEEQAQCPECGGGTHARGCGANPCE